MATGAGFAGHGAPFRSVAERDSLVAHYEVATRSDGTSSDHSLVVLRRVRS